MYELGHLTGTYVCVGLLLLAVGGGGGECTSVSGFPTSRSRNPAAGSNRHVARVHIAGRVRWWRRSCHGLVIANSDKRQRRDCIVFGVPGGILTNPTESGLTPTFTPRRRLSAGTKKKQPPGQTATSTLCPKRIGANPDESKQQPQITIPHVSGTL